MNQVVVTPSGSSTRTSALLDYVQNGVLHVNSEARAVCVTGQNDLAELTGYSPGSIAFTAGYKNIWQLGADGAWVDLLESEEGT